MKFPALALILALCLSLIDAQTLMYVDDQDPRIMYIPQSSWTIVQGIHGDFGGDHMLTQDPNAYAIINMTFISFSFVSAKWPYPVTTDVSVDGGPPSTIDLQDHDSPDVGSGPSTVKADVVWTFNGTANEAHSVKISVPPYGPGYAVLDALIFDGIFPVSNTGSTSHKSHKTAIIAGVICPLGGGFFLFFLRFFLRRFCLRRQRRKSANAAITSRPPPASSMSGHYNQGDGTDAYSPASQPQMLESGLASPQASSVAPS